jgi:hypothetical protein
MSSDLIDDSTGATVVIGLKKALSLSARFSSRFSLVVRSAVTVTESGNETLIYVAPPPGELDVKMRICGFAQELETLLPQVHQLGQGEE